MAFVGTQAVNMRSLTGSWASGQGPDRVRAEHRVKDEVRLEVTASELHSVSFQKRLAEFSTRGVPVQLSLVGEVPQAAVARALPVANAPWSSSNLSGHVSVPSQAAGVGLSMLGGLLGATGTVLLNQALQMGPAPLAEMIGEQGFQGLMTLVTHLDIPTAAMAAIAAGGTAFGGRLIGFKAGDVLRRPGSRIQPAAPASRPARPTPVRLMENALGGWLSVVCTAGSATGGFVGGHLLANAVGAGSPMVLGTAIAAAAVAGTMGLLGGWQIGKNLF